MTTTTTIRIRTRIKTTMLQTITIMLETMLEEGRPLTLPIYRMLRLQMAIQMQPKEKLHQRLTTPISSTFVLASRPQMVPRFKEARAMALVCHLE